MEKCFLKKYFNEANSLGERKVYLDLITQYLGDYKVVMPFYGARLDNGKKYSIQTEGGKKVLFLSELNTKLDVIEIIYTALTYENGGDISQNHLFFQFTGGFIEEQILLLRSRKNITDIDVMESMALIESKICNLHPGLQKIFKEILCVKIDVGFILDNTKPQNNFLGYFYQYLLESNTQEFDIKENKTLSDYLRVGGMNLCVVGNEQKALDIFLEANKKFVDNPEIYSHIAECYELLGDESNAIKYFEMALCLNSNDPSLLKKYFLFHLPHMTFLDQESQKIDYNFIMIKKFIKLFEKIIQNNLGDAEFLEMYGKMNYFLFKSNPAEKKYLEATYKYYLIAHNLEKQNVLYLEMLIETSINLGKYDEFIEYCEQLISFYPSSYITWYCLSELYIKLNNNKILGDFCKSVSQVIIGAKIDDEDLGRAIQQNDWDFVFQHYSIKREEFVEVLRN